MRASRRQFLKTCSLMSIAGAASPFALNLAAISAASAQSLPGYKAIVCLFFYGGNDHTNTFIPYDLASYGEYSASRSSIAIPRDCARRQRHRPGSRRRAGASLPSIPR